MAEPVTVVLAVVGLIAASTAAIEGMKGLLDELGFDRSAVIEIDNATNEPLRVAGAETESGAFHDWPANWIEPSSHLLFSARSRHAAEGVSGHTTLEGNGFVVFVDWSNPLFGSNDIDITVTGPRAGEFTTRALTTGGATGAHLKAELYYTDVNRMEAMLTAQPYGGFAPDATDSACAPAAGQYSVQLPDAYNAVRGGSGRIRFDIIVTDSSGNVRTGRSDQPTRDDSTGGITMEVNECVNGQRADQWSNVGIGEIFGSYLIHFELPSFDHDTATLNESNGYRQVYDDGSSVTVVSWRIPSI
ncbi:hypothetical protein [Streptomyces sp. NPDC002133]|uniref:hypothetical protein n=1 Tax=Streptomyces sp. NPDC002133 TaxID=3154409 RepID=UPI003322AA14